MGVGLLLSRQLNLLGFGQVVMAVKLGGVVGWDGCSSFGWDSLLHSVRTKIFQKMICTHVFLSRRNDILLTDLCILCSSSFGLFLSYNLGLPILLVCASLSLLTNVENQLELNHWFSAELDLAVFRLSLALGQLSIVERLLC